MSSTRCSAMSVFSSGAPARCTRWPDHEGDHEWGDPSATGDVDPRDPPKRCSFVLAGWFTASGQPMRCTLAARHDGPCKWEPRRTYEQAMHAVQTGVAMNIDLDPRESAPKHLRVGVNSALLNQAAIARLLIARGVFTEAEYIEAITAEANKEAEMYEALLSKHFGRPVKLG